MLNLESFVELPGFEPGSKQGNHTLSTCLAPTWFSSNGWIKATDHYLIFLISETTRSVLFPSSLLLAPHYRTGRKRDHPGDVLFQYLVSELSSNLLISVTQQERNYFRQL